MFYPNQRSHTFIKHSLSYLLLTFIAIFSLVSQAQFAPNTSNLPNFAVADEEFLHVDEAYQLMIHQTDTDLIAEWVITDKYFLYGEQFHFSINNQPFEANRLPGEISYDPIFEKDVEKYYVYVQATISKANLPTQAGRLLVTYQGCADAGLCYPPETKAFDVDFPANIINQVALKPDAQQRPQNIASNTSNHVQESQPLLIIVILSALVGGIILNLMPCVFPILSIKALSLMNNPDNHSRIKHGWAYTAGVLSTFVAIAAILLSLRGAGAAIGWGFQLQSPAVITFLALLFAIMGMSLAGLINLGGRWMGIGQSLTQGHHTSHSFFTGVLAVVVASPCTAPFMAGALGYAFTQSAVIALLIFAFLGLGMALPFLLLSLLPQLGRYLPQPGPWMETFKQALAYPLYLTSIWLLWVLGRQVGFEGVIFVIIGLVAILFLLWLASLKARWNNIAALAIIATCAGIIWGNSHMPPAERQNHAQDSLWQPYSASKLSELRLQGTPVFVNVTADWCITCKVNEKWTFTKNTLQQMNDRGIYLMQGDWTNPDPAISALLNEYDRGGIPLYLLFSREPGAAPTILPQILTPTAFKAEVSNI